MHQNRIIYSTGFVKTHGLSSHPLYRIYGSIKHRSKVFICIEWLDSFTNFYKDLYPSYKENHILYRIDKTKGYYKSNVAWKPKLRKPPTPFKQTINTLDFTIKSIELLINSNVLEDSKEDISLLLNKVIKELKEQRI